jgi:Ca2+-binding RTX toxin-like protein
MTNIAFAPNVPNSFVNFFNLMDVLTQQASIDSFTPVTVVASFGTTQFTIQGTGLSVQLSPGDSDLISGAIDSITIRENGVDTIFLTAAGLSAAKMYAATLAEEATPGTPNALEKFLGGLGYNYTGTAGADVLLANARSSDNVLINLRAADTVNLAGGDDNFFLGAGNDTGRGGAGNDTLLGSSGNDQLLGQTGNDSLNGGGGNDRLYGGTENDRLSGSLGNDRLYGEAGNDRLDGSSGADLLVGGGGLDRLIAGTGRDTLTGGADRDDFVFARAADLGTGANRDRITDFVSGLDKINLVGLNLDAFVGATAFSGTQAEARFVLSGGDGLLQVDSDGNGTLDASLLLVGVTCITAADLLL